MMLEEDSYIEFKFVNNKYETCSEVTHKIPLDVGMNTILEHFERFLHGIGYVFDGTIDLVEPDQTPHEYVK